MKIKAGHYRTEFSPDGMWRTYYKDNLIAATRESMWNNSTIPFESREAGELLLNTTIEITSSLDEIVKDIPDSGMEKTDLGDVEDVPSPSDKINENNDEKNEPLSEERFIMIKIQSILDNAVIAQANGQDVTALFAEIDEWHKRYNMLQKLSLLKEYEELIVKAEQDLSNDIDCTASLDRAEEIVRALRNGKFY